MINVIGEMGLPDKNSTLQKTMITCSSSGSGPGSLIRKKNMYCTVFSITIVTH